MPNHGTATAELKAVSSMAWETGRLLMSDRLAATVERLNRLFLG